MDKKIIEELKQALESQKKTIEKELETFAKKDDAPKGDWETKYPNRENGTMEEEADEVQEYGNLLPVEYSLEVKLKDINSALEKIVPTSSRILDGKVPTGSRTREEIGAIGTKGEYGICEKCGKEIDGKRLSACPEAKTCLKCEK